MASSFLGPEERCEYLSDRNSTIEFAECYDLTPIEYERLLGENWRRFGVTLFRPQCSGCALCFQIRIRVADFHPTRAQRRAWQKNHGIVECRVCDPDVSIDRLDLYERYHRSRVEQKGWRVGDPITPMTYALTFVLQPMPTEEWQYRLDGQLIAVGYVDSLPESLSAMYFFSDPGEARRSLGVFNVLSILERARADGKPYVYLGYYVPGSRSMAYKALYQPCEVLVRGKWVSWEEFIRR